MKRTRNSSGFTIVELLIVIVIIGILATIVIVAYNGITTKARQVTLQADLANSRSKLELANATDGQYPSVATVNANQANYLAQSAGNSLTYNTNGTTYCISAIGPDNITYVISNLAGPMTGSCTGTNSEVATAGPGVTILIPANLTATASGNTIQLSWSAAAGATGYELQWRQGTSGSFTNLPVGSVTSYTHTGLVSNKTYQYQVRTVKSSLQSDWSSVVSATTPVGDGSLMQVITASNCPNGRIRAVDARDNHTYWVQKLADGKCWMLTNLGYAGGGTNTYGDVKSIGVNLAATYTSASYYNPTGSNVTTEPTNPSTLTDGSGQYGYLYNWCAAMGGQTSTGACLNATTPAPNTAISVCPSGWRLPTGSSGAEFTILNNAINSGSTTSDAGLLGSGWLGQRSGWWGSGFNNQGGSGNNWSSSQYSAAAAYNIGFTATNVYPANNNSKTYGFAVRCVAL